MSTPSAPVDSFAILHSTSCARCMGLRVWNATTFLQPRSAISALMEPAVRKVPGKSSSK